MSKRIKYTAGFLLVLLIAACSNQSAPNLETQGAEASRYVVVFKKSEVSQAAEKAIAAAGGTVVRSLPQVGLAIVSSSNPAFAEQISGKAEVSSAGMVSAEALPESHEGGGYLQAPTAADDLFNAGLVWGVERIHAPEAWAAGDTGSHDTVVAIIDTGIATNHPDLAPNIVYTDCFVSTGSKATGACTPYPSFSDHGTHVAGTVAAAFGGGRVVGVGPNLGLAGYNTFEPIEGCGICTYSDTRWAAMIDAADRGFDVINMSLGSLQRKGGKGTNELNAYIQAENRVAKYVLKAGTTIVASAGNSNVNLNGLYYNTPGGVPGIINVGATGIRPEPRYTEDSYDVRSFFSNYGAQVDISAPGGDCGLPDSCNPATRPENWFEYLVLSSTVAPSPACAATKSCPVGYGWKAGTSMASPHVAGVAGLVRDAMPGLSPKQVTSLLKRTADDVGSRQLFGHGVVDAYEATR